MPQRSPAEALELIVDRTRSTLKAIDNEFPYVADPDSGEWVTTEDGNWCGGHWIGLCWLAYDQSEEGHFAEAATDYTSILRENMPAENMFYGMNHHYAGFRAADVIVDSQYHEIGFEGADRTVAYYNERARQVPLGTLAIEAPASNFRGPKSDEGPSGHQLGAVDAIYTALPILWRAYHESGDPIYRDIAVSHADRHLDWYIRDDGRTWHHAHFDLDTGNLLKQYNELAYSNDTCWARGQGWCIAGLARAYSETGGGRYLEALHRVVDYYVEHTPADSIPHWDFEHPKKPDIPRDTSAAALAAYGLARLPNTTETRSLREIGNEILQSLITDYLTPRGPEDDRPPGMVLESCYNGPARYATAHEHIWTDYYLAYTLAHKVQSENRGS